MQRLMRKTSGPSDEKDRIFLEKVPYEVSKSTAWCRQKHRIVSAKAPHGVG